MILILDGPNLLHRVTWVATQTALVNQKGEDVGAAFKFLKSLFSLANRFHPKEFYAVWDTLSTVDNYRKTLTEGTYKAGRDKTNQDVIFDNETKLVPVLRSLGILNFYSKDKIKQLSLLVVIRIFFNLSNQRFRFLILSNNNFILLKTLSV